MKPFVVRARILVLAMLFCTASISYGEAGDGIEVTGNALAYLLPAFAGGLTLGYKDGEGTQQLAESTALALGTTYALKYIGTPQPP